MKKIYFRITAAVLLFTILLGAAAAAAPVGGLSLGLRAYAEDDEEVMSGKCGDDVYWKLDDDGTLTISGTGDMYNYRIPWSTNDDNENAPWYGYNYQIKSIVIESGVTSIGNGAFHNFNSCTCVIIPNSVKTIGNSVFYYCYPFPTIYYFGTEDEWNNVNLEYDHISITAPIFCAGNSSGDTSGDASGNARTDWGSESKMDYDILPNIVSAASRLFEPWGIRFFAEFTGSEADSIQEYGVAILNEEYFVSGMSNEEFYDSAIHNGYIYLYSGGGGALEYEQPSTQYPGGRYIATLDKDIYSYDIGADYYVVPFAVMPDGTVFGKIKSNSMERILRENIGRSDVSVEEKWVCRSILVLRDYTKGYYAQNGIPGAIYDNAAIARGSSQSAAAVSNRNAAAVGRISSGASRLIEPWGLRYFYTPGTAQNVSDRGVIMLSETYYDSSYASSPDNMRWNAHSYVFTVSDGTLVYDENTGRYYATLTDGISSRYINRTYYVVPFVVNSDGSYSYGAVKSNSMLNILNNNLEKNTVSEAEKNVIRAMKALHEAVKIYYSAEGYTGDMEA